MSGVIIRICTKLRFVYEVCYIRFVSQKYSAAPSYFIQNNTFKYLAFTKYCTGLYCNFDNISIYCAASNKIVCGKECLALLLF